MTSCIGWYHKVDLVKRDRALKDSAQKRLSEQVIDKSIWMLALSYSVGNLIHRQFSTR